MKHMKKTSKYIVSTVGIAVIAWLSYLVIGLFLPIDFSQDYRKIQGIEDIIFVRNGWHSCYKRAFWGLKRMEDDQIDNFDNAHGSDSSLDLLKVLIETDNGIRQAIYSPDQKYILYCEIEYGYREGGGGSDDEYCYYRVYEIESGKIITIYQAYREWYNLFWTL